MKTKIEWIVFRNPATNVVILRRFNPAMGAAPQFYHSGKNRYVYSHSTTTTKYIKHEYVFHPATSAVP